MTGTAQMTIGYRAKRVWALYGGRLQKICTPVASKVPRVSDREVKRLNLCETDWGKHAEFGTTGATRLEEAYVPKQGVREAPLRREISDWKRDGVDLVHVRSGSALQR